MRRECRRGGAAQLIGVEGCVASPRSAARLVSSPLVRADCTHRMPRPGVSVSRCPSTCAGTGRVACSPPDSISASRRAGSSRACWYTCPPTKPPGCSPRQRVLRPGQSARRGARRCPRLLPAGAGAPPAGDGRVHRAVEGRPVGRDTPNWLGRHRWSARIHDGAEIGRHLRSESHRLRRWIRNRCPPVGRAAWMQTPSQSSIDHQDGDVLVSVAEA